MGRVEEVLEGAGLFAFYLRVSLARVVLCLSGMVTDFALYSMFIFSMGLFYPIFYIQLDAVKHGVDSNFAFYSVCQLS